MTKALELRVMKESGKSDAALIAESVFRPSVHGAITTLSFADGFDRDLDLNAMADELAGQAKAVHDGNMARAEAILAVQAHTLDLIFNRLAQRAAGNIGHNLGMVESYLRLALRAQAQCARTLEVLAGMKHPPVVIAQQANIAHGHQQVNNGVVSAAAPCQTPPDTEHVVNSPSHPAAEPIYLDDPVHHGNLENAPNKLLSQSVRNSR